MEFVDSSLCFFFNKLICCLADQCLQYVYTGEFTLRAFLNGRLDLSQAENVGRLIAAKSVAAAESALANIQVYLFL